eukprot:CAMPEP_0117452934 /NCGR_PEP_ID=MMETSP0759-20121206/9914_1 /TAXON_ID=63605 /ORGANISM="Percolomonas cosmopolitus, Strain WS" /LENGTH=522 /DNA_ID=CAMNT_0005245851 /DNA_START=62 /DNA_END=1630 /DNA_ORIENTATION=-
MSDTHTPTATSKKSTTQQDDKMTDVDESLNDKKTEQKKELSQSELDQLRIEDFKQALKFIVTGVLQKNDRVLGRAWRKVYQFRSNLNAHILLTVAKDVLPEKDYSHLKQILSQVDKSEDAMTDVDDAQTVPDKVPLPEVHVFLYTFVVIYLIDKNRLREAVELSNQLVETIDQNFSHLVTVHFFSAKAYFYYAYAHELSGTLASIRPTLLTAFRKATLRHSHTGQAMLMNLLLRNYLHDGLYEEARKLIDKSPEIEFRSTAQLARFYYYEGRISAIQLDYSKAFDSVMTAARKAPVIAKGFRLSAYKLAIIVQLLMGEIPERSLFEQLEFRTQLKPYFELTKQVRIGDLATFKDVVNQHRDLFFKDRTFSLIQRIRQNVIRTGLHKISLSYSKISFRDICEKLNLDNPEDVECIVAKAIRDGIIDAVIDHEGGFVRSRQRDDPYTTADPADAFHSRIKFCMDIQQQAVKALRFPPRGFLDAEQQDKREDRQKEIKTYVAHHTQKDGETKDETKDSKEEKKSE